MIVLDSYQPENPIRPVCDKYRHLVCLPYSIENLHKMAERFEIKQCWFHKDHYDIPYRKTKLMMMYSIIVRPRDILSIIQGTFIENSNNNAPV